MENTILDKIESRLILKAKKMNHPILDEDLGVIVYLANLYRNSQQIHYRDNCLLLFNKLIENYDSYDFSYSFIHGFEGIFYAVFYLEDCGILESEEITEELVAHLLISIDSDLTNNRYNFLHGCIGKAQYFLFSNKHDSSLRESIFNKIVNTLEDNKIYLDGFITWNDYLIRRTLNIFHHSSILNFLLKLKEIKFENNHLDSLIQEILHFVKNYPDMDRTIYIQKDIKTFPKQNIINLANSKGNLTAAYTLLYASEVLENQELFDQAKIMTELVCNLNLNTSGIIYFEKHNLYDIGLSHGIGGIVFLLSSINRSLKSQNIQNTIEYWMLLLTKNTEIVLNTEEIILMPNDVWQNEDGTYPYDKYSLYDGILGIAFLFSALKYNDYRWSNCLSFYK